MFERMKRKRDIKASRVLSNQEWVDSFKDFTNKVIIIDDDFILSHEANPICRIDYQNKTRKKRSSDSTPEKGTRVQTDQTQYPQCLKTQFKYLFLVTRMSDKTIIDAWYEGTRLWDFLREKPYRDKRRLII